jgi:tetratricopeptide (TPR) repeat protein
MKIKIIGILFLIACNLNAASSRPINSNSEKTKNVHSEKITKLLNAHEKTPEDTVINNRLGYLYYLIGKYKNSEYHYKKAITSNPQNIESRLGLYLLSMADKDYQTAELYCRQINDIDRFNYYGNLYFVNALASQGKYNKAVIICNKMLNLYPCDLVFLRLLKNIYTYQKDTKKAEEVQARLDLLK